MLHRLNHLRTEAKKRLAKMNLFRKECSTSQIPDREEVALASSRIYIILLSAIMTILALFNGFSLINVIKTVPSPSLATFDQLQDAYPVTLVCYCQNASVSFSSFMSAKFKYHQVIYVD